MITREVEIRSFRTVPMPWEIGRRILVCQDPVHAPKSWQEVEFISGPPTLDPLGMDPPDIEQGTAWGDPDAAAKTLHALATTEGIEGGGWWAGQDREALRLSGLLDAGAAWMVPPSAKIDEGEDR